MQSCIIPINGCGRHVIECVLEQQEELSCLTALFLLKHILKSSTTTFRSNNQNNNYNSLLCFRHEKVSHDY